MTDVLLIAGVCLLAYIAWKVSAQKPQESDADRIHREMLENLRKEMSEHRHKDREHLQERMDSVSKLLTDNMQESSKTLHAHFGQSTKIIREVTEKLTKIDETNKQVLGFSDKFATQLRELETVLKNPKGKGLISEYWLETMLSHVLAPNQYKMQYSFPNGEIVDAAVFFQDKIIPVDAKFSSERYNRIVKEENKEMRAKLERAFKQDLKARIDETSKYIRPKEGTTDFAFMFLPSEGIYYDLLVQKVGTVGVNRIDLIEYAFGKRVIIVSPVTFFAYLQTVLQGLKALSIEENAKEIQKRVVQLGKHISAFDEFMQKLGNNLGTTVNTYDKAYRELKKVDKDVLKLSDGEEGGEVEVLEVEKPVSHLS